MDKCFTEAENHAILSPVIKMRLPGVWAKFLRRLMGLHDGQYLLSIEIADGRIVTWREFVGGKTEQ